MQQKDTIPTVDNVLFHLQFNGPAEDFPRFAKKFMNQMIEKLSNPMTEEDKRLHELLYKTELQIYGVVPNRKKNTILIVKPDNE